MTKWRQIERYIILVKCGLLKEKHVIHEIYEKFVITRDRRISCLLSLKFNKHTLVKYDINIKSCYYHFIMINTIIDLM